MWMVSREMVMPFHPRRIAPFGDGSPLDSPIAFTCRAPRLSAARRAGGARLQRQGRRGARRGVARLEGRGRDGRLLEDGSDALPGLDRVVQHLVARRVAVLAVERKELPRGGVDVREDPFVHHQLHAVPAPHHLGVTAPSRSHAKNLCRRRHETRRRQPAAPQVGSDTRLSRIWQRLERVTF